MSARIGRRIEPPLVGAFLVLGAAWSGACAPAFSAGPAPQRFTYEEPHMGTNFRVVLYSVDRAAADAAAAAAFRTAARLDSLFSDYRDDSEIGDLARHAGGEARPVGDDLWHLLGSATWWAQRTGGAFTVTVGPLTRLWRWAMRRGELPDSARLAAARDLARPEGLALDPGLRTARLARPGMSLDLGGIAKGFAADAMLDTLSARDIVMALVDAGGDLALGEAPPASEGWRVEFPDGEVYHLEQVGVATSGDRYRFVDIGATRYSHVVDPRTGLGVPDSPVVVVLARDATTADVLASALSVLGAEAGFRLVQGLDGVEARRTGSLAVEGGDWQTAAFPRPRGRP